MSQSANRLLVFHLLLLAMTGESLRCPWSYSELTATGTCSYNLNAVVIMQHIIIFPLF